MNIAIIAAMGRNRAIGRDNRLPWAIPEDLARFKALTMGHPIIMGRKTWMSLPKGALPGRRNIVVSRAPLFTAPGAEVFASLADALRATVTDPLVFIIGGGEIYRQMMPLADTIHLTRIDADCPDADTFFPLPDEREWELAEASETHASADGIEYRFETWARRANP
ncbi:MAG TPA: dihydrofolate reductase [Prevotella sp.]|nr:dihydrofolate reductase [Prevotella sp.]